MSRRILGVIIGVIILTFFFRMLGRLVSLAGMISADGDVPQTDDRENPLEDYPIIVGSGSEIFR